MRAAALAFGDPARALRPPPDALMAADMVSVPELLGLLRLDLPRGPRVIT